MNSAKQFFEMAVKISKGGSLLQHNSNLVISPVSFSQGENESRSNWTSQLSPPGMLHLISVKIAC